MADEGAETAIATSRTSIVRAYDVASVFPAILDRLATGEPLQQIARDEGMPSAQTVLLWSMLPEWVERYARAREAGYSLIGEQLLEIADDSRNDWMDRETASGRIERVVDREAMERTRLRLDTRKWMLAKMLPKIYGDRLILDANVTVGIAFARLSSPTPGDDE